MNINPVNMQADIDHWLIGRDELEKRVAELGARITEDYRGKDVLMVGILKGAVVFFSDLIRHVDIPVAIDFMAISSYGSATKSSGVVRILKDLDNAISGRHVIIVEDIVDTGKTLAFLKETLLARGAASLKICTLLDKPDRRQVEIEADYFGFVIPNEFVVGYGLCRKVPQPPRHRRAQARGVRLSYGNASNMAHLPRNPIINEEKWLFRKIRAFGFAFEAL